MSKAMRNFKAKPFGVGIRDLPSRENGEKTKAYKAWMYMLRRCYHKSFLDKNPSYHGCFVREDWLTFSNFAKWYSINHREGFHLDKDILSPTGVSYYSASTCVYVPRYINNLVMSLDIKSVKGFSADPRDKTLVARMGMNGRNKHIGCYKSIEEAHAAYVLAKVRFCSETLDRALAKGDINSDIYEALSKRVRSII